MSDTNYAVIYDLHSHTTASDGCLTPEELVHRAVEMRVGTLAITDHDTTAAKYRNHILFNQFPFLVYFLVKIRTNFKLCHNITTFVRDWR